MGEWYRTIVTNNDLSQVVDCIEFFEAELEKAKKETLIKGNVERLSSQMPGIVEHRFNQLQELEAILEWLNIKLSVSKFSKFKEFFEGYNKALKYTEAQHYADHDSDVIAIKNIINDFALVRNKYGGIMKALESKSFQLNNIVKLRTAGMEDSEIDVKQPNW